MYISNNAYFALSVCIHLDWNSDNPTVVPLETSIARDTDQLPPSLVQQSPELCWCSLDTVHQDHHLGEEKINENSEKLCRKSANMYIGNVVH